MRIWQRSGEKRQEEGFTLVELLVALTVIALTMAVAVTSLRLLGSSGERGARVIARHDMLSRGVDALRRDIERLERVVRKRERDAEFVFYGDEKDLVFVVVEPPVPSEPGPYFIGYSIMQGDAGGALVRRRAPYNASAKDIRRGPTQDEVTIIEGPYHFRFAYMERRDGEDRWVTRWLDHSLIPVLIRLEVSGRVDGISGLPPLIFSPRSDAEQGCIKDGGSECTLRTGGTLPAQPAVTQERN